MKTLYKKDSKGNIRIWAIYTVKDQLIQEAGLLNGKLVKHTKVCKPKNVGKSNETSGSEQAILEMESVYKSKLDEGYFPTLKEVNEEVVILPMLAKSFDDEKDKIDWNECYVQPKLDGCRMLAFVKKNGSVKLMSRQGKEFTTLDHIKEDLSEIEEDVILDGEAYCHGQAFQENMRLIKKYRKGETEKVQFRVYDIISDKCFRERSASIRGYIVGLSSCTQVETFNCPNEQTLKEHHENNIADGYEGSIVRWGLAPYKINGRSSNLLKYKDFQDIDATIIDILPNDANPLHGTPLLEYKKSTFKAGVKMSHSEREDLLKNKKKYIGKKAEIRFFEYSEEGIPRFPVMVGIRLDK